MREKVEYVASVVAVALIAALVWALSCVIAQTLDNHAGAEEIKTYEEEYLPGQSLDAVRVNAPSFSDCEYAYKSCDRTSGASGWYVRIEGDWTYMPVTLGNQQLIGAPPAKEGE